MKSLRTISVILPAICLMILNGCVPDAPFKFEGSTVPQQMDDGWQVASPEDVNINPSDLDEVYQNFLSEVRYLNSKSLLVVKDNKLVFEAYCRSDDDRARIGHVMSVTKSVTSLTFGIVKSDGFIDSLGQRIYDIMPEKFPSDAEKRSITLEQLLTMSSGLAFDNDVFSMEIIRSFI